MLTKQDFETYVYLDKAIKDIEHRLEKRLSHPPTAEHGKVRGSSSIYPFCERGFTVSGPNLVDRKEYDQKNKELFMELSTKKTEYEEKKQSIEQFINDIQDPKLYIIFSLKFLKKKTDEEISQEVFLERSWVNRIVNEKIKELVV